MTNARYRRKQLAKRADWREFAPASPTDGAAGSDQRSEQDLPTVAVPTAEPAHTKA